MSDPLDDMLAAINSCSSSEVKKQLRRGISVNCRFDDEVLLGHTPLHVAAENNIYEILDFLIEEGADLDARTPAGETPLHIAAFWGKLKIVEILVTAGADLYVEEDLYGKIPLDLAWNRKHKEVYEYLKQAGELDSDLDRVAAEQLFSLLEDCGLTEDEMDRFEEEDICSIAMLKELTKAELRQDLGLSLGKATSVSRAVATL